MDQGYQYLEETPVYTESAYPYKGVDEKCNLPEQGGVAKLTGFQDIKANSPMSFKAALAEGPVAVAIDASTFHFQFYRKGIIKKWCGTRLDHGVLAVGYGTEDGVDYYVVKNSWGPKWGDHGFFKVLRNDTAEEP